MAKRKARQIPNPHELARNRLALGIVDGWRRHRVIEDDLDLAAIRNSLGHQRGRGEGQIDLNDHIDVADHDIAGARTGPPPLCRERIFPAVVMPMNAFLNGASGRL